MYKIIGILVLLFGVVSMSEATIRFTAEELNRMERAGVKHYKRGNYKKAYEKLLFPAKVGSKTAQYFISFLYLKGQHVPQSIKTGMAWLGVANEVEVGEWRQTYNTIYNQLNVAQRQMVDNEVALFINLYGMDAQQILCSNRAKVGSRKVQVFCDKRAGAVTTLYEGQEGELGEVDVPN